MKRTALFIVLTALILGLLAVLPAQEVTVSGRVIANDEPDGLVNAAISFVSVDNVYNTQSGENGEFTLEEVQGTTEDEGIDYGLTVYYEGYFSHFEIHNVTTANIDAGVIEITEQDWSPVGVEAREDVQENVVNLTWDTPAPAYGTEQWLSQGADRNHTGVGSTVVDTIAVGHRFSAEQLREHDVIGLYITAVSFFPRVDDPEYAQYTLHIYRGGTRIPLEAGEMITSQFVEDITANQWNEVVLNEPVEIKVNQEIWVTYEVQDPLDTRFPIGCDPGPAYEYYGDLVLEFPEEEGWVSLNQRYNINFNINLKAYAGAVRGDRSVALSHDRRRRITAEDRYSDETRVLEQYEIYRFPVEDEDDPEEWIHLGSVPAEETIFTDTTWDEAGEGLHRFAVIALYTGDIYSKPALSNVIYPPDLFAGGIGTESSPWQIETAEHLHKVRDFTGEEHRDKYFIQISDIDLGVPSWNEGEGWEPLGTEEVKFTGFYDGNNHIISNMTIERSEPCQGLFGYIGGSLGAVLKNIRLEDIEIRGENHLGGLTGRSSDNSVVKNCHVSGLIETSSARLNAYAGGLIGYAKDTDISNSSSSGSVISTQNNQYLGGLLGYGEGLTIVGSRSTSDVLNGGRYIGGFVGRFDKGRITDSYARGEVTGTDRDAGGFIGTNVDGDIYNCYATGEVDAPQSAGGFIGHHRSGMVENCYWDTESSQQDESDAGEGRTTLEMTYPYEEDTYVNWDFAEIWTADTTYVPEEMGGVNDGYPYLFWQPSPYPVAAVDPKPEDEAEDVPVDLEKLSWSYYPEENTANPEGFRVYLNKTGEFSVSQQRNNDFVWVPYVQDQVVFLVLEILPDDLEYETVYYWQVVPTTKEEGTGEGYDAKEVDVWSFKTEKDTSVEEDPVPLVTQLKRNYPNPFNPATTIEFSLAGSEEVTVEIFDIKGRKVITLVDDYLEAGHHSIVWHGLNSSGQETPSGVYFYRMQAGNYNSTDRMILVK